MRRKKIDDYESVIETFTWSNDDRIYRMQSLPGGIILVNKAWWDSLSWHHRKQVIDEYNDLNKRSVYGVYV